MVQSDGSSSYSQSMVPLITLITHLHQNHSLTIQNGLIGKKISIYLVSNDRVKWFVEKYSIFRVF